MTKGRSKGSGRGIKVVRERYSDLNQLIGDLSLKLSEVSSSIDNEFLSAYRVHMVDVQEDLKSLKQQVSPAVNDSFAHPIDIYRTKSVNTLLLFQIARWLYLSLILLRRNHVLSLRQFIMLQFLIPAATDYYKLLIIM